MLADEDEHGSSVLPPGACAAPTAPGGGGAECRRPSLSHLPDATAALLPARHVTQVGTSLFGEDLY